MSEAFEEGQICVIVREPPPRLMTEWGGPHKLGTVVVCRREVLPGGPFVKDTGITEPWWQAISHNVIENMLWFYPVAWMRRLDEDLDIEDYVIGGAYHRGTPLPTPPKMIVRKKDDR